MEDTVIGNQLWHRSSFQVGTLARKKIGQVTAKGKLVGFFVAPPPFPTENLTVPYYSDPPNTTYVGTTQVALISQQMNKVRVSKERSHEVTFNLEYEGGFANSMEGSIFGIKASETETHFGVKGQHEKSWGKDSTVAKEKTWLRSENLTVKSNGIWREDTQLEGCEMRFHHYNNGIAMMKSYAGDMILIYDEWTGAMIDIDVEVDLDRDPEVTTIPFPLNPLLHDMNAVDGHVGNQKHPNFPLADEQPCSFYNPKQAALDQRQIKQIEQEQRASLQSLHEGKGIPAETTFPLPGLMSRLSFTSANTSIVHTEEFSEQLDTCFSNRKFSSHGAGIHFDHQTTLAGFGGYFHSDKMLTLTSVKISALSSSIGHGLQLQPEITGEASTKIWDVKKMLEQDKECPGKVPAFTMAISFLPPSLKHTKYLRHLIDPSWLHTSSPMPNALALSDALSTMNPLWKVEPYLTSISRIPDEKKDGTSVAIHYPEPYPKEGNRALLKEFKGILHSKKQMTQAQVITEAKRIYNDYGGNGSPDPLIKYLLRYTLSKGCLSD